MVPFTLREVHLVDVVGAVVVAAVFITVMSLLKEPMRQRFNAVFVAGAGSVYFSGGLGPWEFALPLIISVCAYLGLRSYRFIGVAWLAHTVFDVLHHLYGAPIISFAPTSSAGCAVCDPLLALWFFAGAPSVFELLRRPWRAHAGSELEAALPRRAPADE